MSFSRRDFLKQVPLAAVSAQTAKGRKPNFVVIVTDDQGIGDMGCYGHAEVRTPHLDRLAESGVRFTQWYANAPICSASRAALLTGKYPDRTGVKGALPSEPDWSVPGLRAGERTLPGLLRDREYRTAAFGKWHLGSAPPSRPLAQGFDEFFGWYSGWLDAYSHRYYQLGGPPGKIFHDLWHNGTEVFEEPAYMTELLGQKAQAFLGHQSAARPFFMYLAFGAPHYSMMAPQRYLTRFPPNMDRDRRMHLAMVAAVDDVVGAVLDQLKQQGLEKDTVIWFQSDNGATREARASSDGKPYRGGSNAPYRGWKQGLFDGGIHVPALLRVPGITKPGTVWDRPMISMDLLPTFLALSGESAVPGVDGRNILPVLQGEVTTPTRDLFWSFEKSRAVRVGDWKLILRPPSYPGDELTDEVWLSNLEADPGEQRNLAGTEVERVRTMTEKIRGWEREVRLAPQPNP